MLHILQYAGRCHQADARDPIWYQPLDYEMDNRRDLYQVIRREPVYHPHEVAYKCRNSVLKALEHELFAFMDKPMRGVIREAIFMVEDLGVEIEEEFDEDNPPYATAIPLDKVTFDTGANSANYIAWDVLLELDIDEDDERLLHAEHPHVVTLGDGNHRVVIETAIKLKVGIQVSERHRWFG